MIAVDKHLRLAASGTQWNRRHAELVEHTSLLDGGCGGCGGASAGWGFACLHQLLLLFTGIAVQQIRATRLRKLFDGRRRRLSDVVQCIVGVVGATCRRENGKTRSSVVSVGRYRYFLAKF